VLLLGLLPEQGNILMLRVVREARQLLEFRAEELRDFELSQEAGMIRWDSSKAKEVDIPLSAAALGLIREKLQEMDRGNTLTSNHLPLWEKLFAGQFSD
jgi:hypothetical protein